MRDTDLANATPWLDLKSWHMVTYAGLAQFKQEEPEISSSRSATYHSSVKFQLFQHLDEHKCLKTILKG